MTLGDKIDAAAAAAATEETAKFIKQTEGADATLRADFLGTDNGDGTVSDEQGNTYDVTYYGNPAKIDSTIRLNTTTAMMVNDSYPVPFIDGGGIAYVIVQQGTGQYVLKSITKDPIAPIPIGDVPPNKITHVKFSPNGKHIIVAAQFKDPDADTLVYHLQWLVIKNWKIIVPDPVGHPLVGALDGTLTPGSFDISYDSMSGLFTDPSIPPAPGVAHYAFESRSTCADCDANCGNLVIDSSGTTETHPGGVAIPGEWNTLSDCNGLFIKKLWAVDRGEFVFSNTTGGEPTLDFLGSLRGTKREFHAFAIHEVISTSSVSQNSGLICTGCSVYSTSFVRVDTTDFTLLHVDDCSYDFTDTTHADSVFTDTGVASCFIGCPDTLIYSHCCGPHDESCYGCGGVVGLICGDHYFDTFGSSGSSVGMGSLRFSVPPTGVQIGFEPGPLDPIPDPYFRAMVKDQLYYTRNLIETDLVYSFEDLLSTPSGIAYTPTGQSTETDSLGNHSDSVPRPPFPFDSNFLAVSMDSQYGTLTTSSTGVVYAAIVGFKSPTTGNSRGLLQGLDPKLSDSAYVTGLYTSPIPSPLAGTITDQFVSSSLDQPTQFPGVDFLRPLDSYKWVGYTIPSGTKIKITAFKSIDAGAHIAKSKSVSGNLGAAGTEVVDWWILGG